MSTNTLAAYEHSPEGNFMARFDALPKALRDAVNYIPVGMDPWEMIEAYETGAPIEVILKVLNEVVTRGLYDEVSTTGVKPIGWPVVAQGGAKSHD